MTNREDGIYLTAGVFFALVQTGLRRRTKPRDSVEGKSDGLKQPNMFADLIRVVDPDFVPPSKGSTFEGNASDFKTCRFSGDTECMPVGGNDYAESFNQLLADSPAEAFDRMAAFVDKYIDVEKHGQHLVARLLYVLNADLGISPTWRFLANTEYETSKKILLQQSSVYLEVFLTALWHFCATERLENTRGRSTFQKFFQQRGNSTSWKFDKSSIPLPAQLMVDIERWLPIEDGQSVEAVFLDEDETASSAYDEDARSQGRTHVPAGGFVQQAGQQTMFIMNGDYGTQIQHVETLNLGSGR